METDSTNPPEENLADADISLEQMFGVDDGIYRVNTPQTSYEDALDTAVVEACDSVMSSKKLTLKEKQKWLTQLNDPKFLNPAGRERLLNKIYDLLFPEMEVLDENGGEVAPEIQSEQFIFEKTPYERRDEILDWVYERGCMNFPYVAPYRKSEGEMQAVPKEKVIPKIYLPSSLMDFDKIKPSSPEQAAVEWPQTDTVSNEEEDARVYALGQIADNGEFAYYDETFRCYWIKNKNERWISIKKDDLIVYLKMRDLPHYNAKMAVSPCEQEIARIQTECSIVFAGQVAGLKAGIHNDPNTGYFLVKENPKYITPVPGAFPTLETLFDNLFNDPVADQRPYLYGWLRWTMEAYYSGIPRRGHALILIGPPNVGKSLFQDIFTAMVGGGVGRPYQYMTGQTTFNSDMFAYVHQRIEDESAPGIFRSKDLFTEKFKELVTHVEKRCHPKGREALTLIPLWRLTMSLNDEPESLKLLPRLTNSIEDKIMVFRVGFKKSPMPSTQGGQEDLWKTIQAELPHFIHHIRNFKIPASLQGRYGIKHFHHPELVANIVMANPEGYLLHLIDVLFFPNVDAKTLPLQMTAGEIEHRIKKPSSPTATVTRDFFEHNSTCAYYLETLSKTHPQRVQKIVRGGKNPPLWEIQPPTS